MVCKIVDEFCISVVFGYCVVVMIGCFYDVKEYVLIFYVCEVVEIVVW